MEENMENEMETGGNIGIQELNLSCHIGETILSTIYIYIHSPLSR